MDEQRSFTFADTNTLVNRFAAGMRAAGVGKGDRVVICMKPSVYYVMLTLAANKLGAVWVPINTDYRGLWLKDAILDSKPALLVTDSTLLHNVQEALEGSLPCPLVCDQSGPGVSLTLADWQDLPATEPTGVDVSWGDTAAILWTSGTTGKPKGVMQSHNAWIRACESGNRILNTRDDDVTYCCLPLYNSAAWVACIFRALLAGIPCAIDQQFSVNSFWDRIRQFKATQTMTLGAMHMFLWNAPARDDDADNPLRVANMVPMPEAIKGDFLKRFGMEKITQGFGQSEVMALVVRADAPGEQWKPNALGRPLPDVEVTLFDDNGNEVPPGEPGELHVKPLAPFVIFNGYFEQPEQTRAAFRGEWYGTGDLCIRDADGDLFFADRKKDVIRYKGRNIASLAVENVALRHPALAAAAAYGVPSDELEAEHEIKLDLVLKPGNTLTPEDMARFINENAPYFMVPRYIEIVESLPYTPTNKIEKYKLRQRGVTPTTWDMRKTGFKVQR